jgi:hypothetical protein
MIQFDYVIRQEDLVRPAVAIDILEDETISSGVDEAFRKKLWDSQTRHGVLFSQQTVRIYEDLLPENDPSAYKDRNAPTLAVLRTVALGKGFPSLTPHQYRLLVGKWVDLLVKNWNAAIPPEHTEEFIGLVPAAAEGILETSSWVEDLVH